jgi:hypothetical protein
MTMTARDEEREIASALKQLRKADEASAPPFHATLTSARAGRASRRTAIGPVLASATLLVVIVGLVIFESKHQPASRRPAPAPSSAEASLESWESPTNFLLDTPGSDLWRGLPRLTEPLPANLPTDSPSSKKGVPS